jgi:hypothetical protein
MRHAALTWLLILSAPDLLFGAAAPTPRGRPNVLFIAIDDLNHWYALTA